MARRNASYQQLFLETLGQVGPAAMQAGKLAGDARREDAESKARLGLIGEQARAAKTTADKGDLDYSKALQEDTLTRALGSSAQERDTALEGTPTPDGRAVDFQAVKKANKGFEQADAKLWNFLNPGSPMAAEGLKAKRARDEGDAALASEEKANKAARDASESEAALGETRARTKLLGAQADKAAADAKQPPEKAKDLPLDVKAEVQGLSGKNAGKVSIANQIDGYLQEFRAAKTDDDKVRIGRQMLKVLNSPEGADAIGVEEAKRLGDALEYNIADVSAGLGIKTGKFHGRDLKGFETQTQATLDAIRGGVNANRIEVDRLMGREPAPAAGSFDRNDPKVKAALAAGYTEDEIKAFLGGRK